MTQEKTTLASLESAAAELRAGAFSLTLYVAGANPRSTRAIERIRRFCDVHLVNRHSLKIVDLYELPGSAIGAGIIAVPTLVKESPGPVRKLIGDLRDDMSIFSSLGLPAPATTATS